MVDYINLIVGIVSIITALAAFLISKGCFLGVVMEEDACKEFLASHGGRFRSGAFLLLIAGVMLIIPYLG